MGLNPDGQGADNPPMGMPEPVGLPEPIPQSYVDKLLVPVRVMLPGPEHLGGCFALAPATPFRDGPEPLLELLNARSRVVPFIRAADAAVMLLSRETIDWVEVEVHVDPAWVRPATYMITREEHVQVRMLDGRKVEGRVSMELPENLNRISDFLNQDDDFFPLTTRAGTMLINKARISCLRLFESSPKPVGESPEHDRS